MPKRLINVLKKPDKGSIVYSMSRPASFSKLRHESNHLDTIITPQVVSESRAALQRVRAKKADGGAVKPRRSAGA